MGQVIQRSVKQMVAQAKAEIREMTTEEVARAVAEDGAQLIDIRDIRELQRDGRIPGAFHCPRGMLEFWIDPDSPYHKPVFAAERPFIFFCAGGLRSALAAKAAQDMGLKPVAHMLGGFGAWKSEGREIEQPA
ncbi:MAG: rhodanese-like domain-containing protein [Hyphomicrobiaceae bacterium]